MKQPIQPGASRRVRDDSDQRSHTCRLIAFMLAGLMTIPGGTPLLRATVQSRPESNVVVCLIEDSHLPTLDTPETKASRIFDSIGVKIRWVNGPVCQPGAEPPIMVVVQYRSSKQFPHALGLALPSDGRHAWVFYDRVRETAEEVQLQTLLGYVLAHEVAHLLQGTIRHSVQGIMKACWDEEDRRHMETGLLVFTKFDTILIHQGLEQRRSRLPNRLFNHPPHLPNPTVP